MSAMHLLTQIWPTQIWPTRIWPGTPSAKPWWPELAAYFRTEALKPAAEPARSGTGDAGTQRRIRIAQGLDGRWRVGGEDHASGPEFALLSQAVVFARDACAAAPATIELGLGQVVAVVHQAAGWPKSICGEAIRQRTRSARQI